MTIERTLKKLQNVARASDKPPDNERLVYYHVLPDDLVTENAGGLHLTHDEDDLRRQTIAELLADERFEHLENEVEDRVWRLFCLAHLDRNQDHVATFIAENIKEPRKETCFFPVEYLNVLAPLELSGALLLPLGDEHIPESNFFRLGPPEGGVIAVPATGTNQTFMRDRARLHARHVLRVLRVGSRADPLVHSRQLRFRLGDRYVFDTLSAGADWPEDAAFETPLSDELLARVKTQGLANIPHEPTNKAERHAKVALEWLDRAFLATDALVATLFRFFALEALLGDEAEGTKALGITFRRTLLGHVVTGHFTPPELVYLLYDEVRSAAVHGSEAPDVPKDMLDSFEYSVRTALNEYLAFVRQEGITKQSKVIKELHEHAEATKILEWLRTHNPKLWKDFEPLL